MDEQTIQDFINRWANSGGAERANYQLFLAELCDVLQVARPEPTVDDDSRNAYVFERNVQFDNLDGTHRTRRIDLYKQSCFVLESKQGVLQHDVAPVLSARQQERRAKRKRGHGTRGTAGWDDAMFRARGQAEQYARSLSPAEGRPPSAVRRPPSAVRRSSWSWTWGISCTGGTAPPNWCLQELFVNSSSFQQKASDNRLIGVLSRVTFKARHLFPLSSRYQTTPG